MARLKARPSQAGSTRRCPRCQFQFVVPDAAQLAARGPRPEEYPIFKGDYRAFSQSAMAAEMPGVAECPRCHTRIYSPEEQIGHETACPDCGTIVLVSRRAEAPAKGGPSAVEEEGYALLDEFYRPAESSPPAEVYIPVHCPVCNTLMHGTLEEVGKHLLCPDCYTPVEVPPPKAPAQEKPPLAHPVDEEYAIREEPDGRAAESRPADKPLIPVVCSLCQTRMHATLEQVGELITCPDCGRPAVVPRPEAPVPKPRPEGTLIGEYGVGKPAERVEYKPRTDVRLVRIEPGDTQALDEADVTGIVHLRPTPPRWPFWTGIFSFLWHPGTWPRLAGLTAGLLVVLLPVIYGVVLMVKTPVAGLGNAAPLVGSMVIMAVGGLLCVVWAVVVSPPLLTVIQDTAEGNDAIESWPEPIFSDWLLDFFYFLNSAAVSVLLGVGVAWLLAFVTPLSPLAVPVTAFVLFPIALVSMLEAGSPLRPLSLNVWGSLFSLWWAWAAFYFETAVLVGGFVFLSGLVVRFLGPWGLLPAAVPSAALTLVYCRLLGRLAWCVAQESREEEEKRDDEDDRPPPADVARPRDATSADRAATAGDATTAPPQEVAKKPPPTRKPTRSILDDDFDLS